MGLPFLPEERNMGREGRMVSCLGVVNHDKLMACYDASKKGCCMVRGLCLSVPGLLAVLFLAACQPADGDLRIEDAWARETPQGAPNGVIYMVIHNDTGNHDALIAVESPSAGHSGIHTHIDDNGVMRMRPRDDLKIPARGTVVLEPGGDHVMLMDLFEPLRAGEFVTVTLTFEQAGERMVSVPSLAMGDMP